MLSKKYFTKIPMPTSETTPLIDVLEKYADVLTQEEINKLEQIVKTHKAKHQTTIIEALAQHPSIEVFETTKLNTNEQG